jgi:hypothetical protein
MNLNPNLREGDAGRLASTPTGANRERLPSPLGDIARGAALEIMIVAAVVLIQFLAFCAFV